MAGMLDSYRGRSDEPEMDDSPSEESSELGDALTAAFPDQEWSPDRVSAFKDAMRLCMDSGYEEPADDEDEGPSGKGPGKSVLALMFGPKSKK